MHVSMTEYHRIYFSNVTNRALLEELAGVLKLVPTDNQDVYDFIQSEGNSTTVSDALNNTLPERFILTGCGDAHDMTFAEVITAFNKMVKDENITLISKLFDAERYVDNECEDCLEGVELFDLLSLLGNTHFKVDGIYTEWALTSSKEVYGAHVGGACITTQYFSVPCTVPIDDTEEVIRTIAKQPPEEMGDYFFNVFIKPIMDRVYSSPLTTAIKHTQARSAELDLRKEAICHDVPPPHYR